MISAIITVYYPDEDNYQNIITVSKQVDRVFVCDNTPRKFMCDVNLPENVKVYVNNKNIGLSAAFNVPLNDIDNTWDNNEYVVFFDQDSTIPDGYIQLLISEYQSLEAAGFRIGCIGPVYYNCSNGKIEIPRRKKQISSHSYIVNSIITSSMLCKYKDIRAIGFWNEDIFLDLADWDVCWRFKHHGYDVIKTDAVVLTHTLGSGEYKKGFIRIRYGAPIREYYQVRDCLYLVKTEYTPLYNKIRFLGGIIYRELFHTRLLNEGRERRHFIKRGIIDFKRGIKGVYK